jgi:hypothetical protein
VYDKAKKSYNDEAIIKREKRKKTNIIIDVIVKEFYQWLIIQRR